MFHSMKSAPRELVTYKLDTEHGVNFDLWVRDQIETDRSIRWVSDQLLEQFDVAVHPETLRRWFPKTVGT